MTIPVEADFAPTSHSRATCLPRSLQQALFASGLGIAGVSGVTYVMSVLLPFPPDSQLPDYLFRNQDLVWLIAVSVFLIGGAFLPARTGEALAGASLSARIVVLVLAGAALLCGVLGARFVFEDGFHLSRDEIMADFDAKIFQAGHLIAPVAAEWRAFGVALSPRFTLPIADNAGFASQYLPGNALLRAFVGLWGDPNWTSPLLAAIAVLATFGVARRLWPERRDVAILAPLLVATSSQVLITAMTSYAMTAHLALNMLWLWLFLRDDKIGHSCAIAIGALACGLHQVIFHPLFVFPFILRLWLDSRRRLALIYIGAYALICLFWIVYPQLSLWLSGMESKNADGAGVYNFAMRALIQLMSGEYNPVALMSMNLLRFVVWENPILLPLALLSVPLARRGEGIARELAVGAVLTIVAMYVVLPSQGHGWGYRYMHGVIGNLALLAAYGWIAATKEASNSAKAGARQLVAIASALSVFVLLPAHAKDTHDFAAPYARARAAIVKADADVVIVDKAGLHFAEDIVRNDPFLRDRPQTLDLTHIDPADIEGLCARHRVALFAQPQAFALGIRPEALTYDIREEMRRAGRAELARLSCGVPLKVAP